jgi:hypothetical protein
VTYDGLSTVLAELAGDLRHSERSGRFRRPNWSFLCACRLSGSTLAAMACGDAGGSGGALFLAVMGVDLVSPYRADWAGEVAGSVPPLGLDQSDVPWPQAYCHLLSALVQSFSPMTGKWPSIRRFTTPSRGASCRPRASSPRSGGSSRRSGRRFRPTTGNKRAPRRRAISHGSILPKGRLAPHGRRGRARSRWAGSRTSSPSCICCAGPWWSRTACVRRGAYPVDGHAQPGELAPHPCRNRRQPRMGAGVAADRAFPITDEKVVLDGRRLIPQWRVAESLGINLRRVFEEPGTFDPFNRARRRDPALSGRRRDSVAGDRLRDPHADRGRASRLLRLVQLSLSRAEAR